MKWAPYPAYQPSGVDWVGDVPAGWKIERLKTLARAADEKVEAADDQPMPYIGLEHIESWSGKLLPLNPDFEPSGICNRVRSGDILFGKLRPYLAKATIADFDSLSSTEFLSLRDINVDARFLLYTVLTEGFIRLVNMSTFGAKMPRANWDFIGSCRLPVPTRNEQRAIARFLDAETAKLDMLVAKKRTLIDRLHEERASLITRTVTRGLPPEIAVAAGLDPSQPLKDTGIEWLRTVPAHWEVKRLKDHGTLIGGAGFPHEHQGEERWPGKFGQRDNWISCLTAAMLPRIRRKHDEANPPDAQPRLQGEGGAGRDQGGKDAGRIGQAV